MARNGHVRLSGLLRDLGILVVSVAAGICMAGAIRVIVFVRAKLQHSFTLLPTVLYQRTTKSHERTG